MLDPDGLRAFVTVAEHGHFVKAADLLGVTQSVVSKRLQRLEDQLGMRLIVRGKRAAVRPTREGELFLPQAKRAISELERIERVARNIGRGEVGPVRIGYVFSAILTGVLPRLIRSLRDSLPDIVVEPSSLETPEQLAAIADGRLDFGIVRPRPSYPAEVTAKRVHRERVMLAMAADNPLANLVRIKPAILSGVSFIVPQFHEEVGLIDIIRDLARMGHFAIPDIIPTRDFISAAGFAAAGMGVAVVPSSLGRLDLDGVVYREVDGHDGWLDLMLVSRADAPAAAVDAIHRATL
jgi:DNA-binding transcriptional LysR family regulator